MCASDDDSSVSGASPERQAPELILPELYQTLFQRALTRRFIPFSPGDESRLEAVGRIHCNFIQGVICLRHNYFQTELLVEEFRETPPESLRLLPRDLAERIFARYISVYRLAHLFSLDIIDFSRFELDAASGTLRFPIRLAPAPAGPSVDDIIRLFSEYSCLGHLSRQDAETLFNQQVSLPEWFMGDAWFYSFSEFASAMLQSCPPEQLETRAAFRIRIHAEESRRYKIVKLQMYQLMLKRGVYIMDPGRTDPETAGTGLAELLTAAVPDCSLCHPAETAGIVSGFSGFMKKAGFRGVAFFIDRLTHRDIAFLDILMAAPRCYSVLAIVFATGTGCGWTFDLELHEKAANHLERNSPFFSSGAAALRDTVAVFNPLEEELAIWRHPEDPSETARLLEKAHEYRIQKDHRRFGECLDALAIPPASPFREEFLYLQYIRYENFDTAKADDFFKKIKSPLFRRLAQIKYCNRAIYSGQLKQAAQTLRDVHSHLQNHGYFREAMEAQAQLAKIHREKNEHLEAQRIYKILHINSEAKNYNLLAADIALDLGNLFFQNNDCPQAELWYLKAERSYKISENFNGAILVLSNLVEIEKIKGNWNQAGEYLKTSLAFSTERRLIISVGIDYYNLAHLEFLRHNSEKAQRLIHRAAGLFREKNFLSGLAQCCFLDRQLRFLRHGDRPIPDDPHNPLQQELDILPERLGDNDRLLADILRDADLNTPSDTQCFQLFAKIQQLPDKRRMFDLLILLAPRLLPCIPELPLFLRELSVQLSGGAKNYFFFEYYYFYFHWCLPQKKVPPELKEIFLEVYYFFHQGRRRLSPLFSLLKEELDERESTCDMFESALLVEDYLKWQTPGDAFASLGTLLKVELPSPPRFLRLMVYEKGTEQPVFDFISEPSSAFLEVSAAVMKHAAAAAEPMELSPAELRACFGATEHAAPLPDLTQVYLWRISETLFSVLLAAFSGETLRGCDLLRRHAILFKKFASLFHEYYEKEYKLNRRLSGLIGRSPAIRRLKMQIERIGKVGFSVLILGESGVGKEVVARAIHHLSDRATRPFVAINAAAIPENLLEAELFGFKKGAFTGAQEDKTGLIQTAHNGALFLDEIADLPLQLQAKLLRVLQENEIRRLGDNRPIHVDFRLLCATNKNLEQLIRENKFREDLYYRIQDLTLHVPPLRERPGDIPLLLRFFMEKYHFPIPGEPQFSKLLSCFESRSWPGNVRELEAAVKRMITFYPDLEAAGVISSPPHPANGLHASFPTTTLAEGLNPARDQFERKLVCDALNRHAGNRQKTADCLKISRQHLFKLMIKHNILDSELSFPGERL